MIQFDGHTFLDGLNAPTRWCFVLDFFKRLLQLRDMFAEETQHGTPSEKDFTKTPAKYCQASEKHLELHMLLV